jgi:hypothetical protein
VLLDQRFGLAHGCRVSVGKAYKFGHVAKKASGVFRALLRQIMLMAGF